MEVKLDQNDAVDWVYRGEGAVNLVLSHTGSSPYFIGKVMRIQKKEKRIKAKPRLLTEQEKLVWRDSNDLVSAPNIEIAEQLYVVHVIRPLIGPKYIDAGFRVTVTREFLECIERNVTSSRPALRVDASEVDLDRDSVLIMSDHSLFPHSLSVPVNAGDVIRDGSCITVEIKPKCGFLPTSRFIAEEYGIKKTVSRFRMHQVLKLYEKEISELSEYDPLDLFSGCRERIHKAIKSLYCTPQNNFRVFLDGSIVFGGLGGSAKRTNMVTVKALEDVLKGVIQADNGLRTASFTLLVAEALYKSGALSRLLEIQKRDTLDIEGAIHAYYNIMGKPCKICTKLHEARLAHRYSSLHSLPMDESLKVVKDYLIAATAKDCSMMVSFRPRKDGDFGSLYSSVYLESTNQSFDYKVSFIDLDLKLLKKMEHYFELDRTITQCYMHLVKGDKKANY